MCIRDRGICKPKRAFAMDNVCPGGNCSGNGWGGFAPKLAWGIIGAGFVFIFAKSIGKVVWNTVFILYCTGGDNLKTNAGDCQSAGQMCIRDSIGSTVQ